MKYRVSVTLSLVLILSLLLGLMPAAAAHYTWTDGQVPEGWAEDYISSADQVTATDILSPVNPNATQQAKNLYAYLCSLVDSQNYVIGQFDIAGDNAIYESVSEEFGMQPGLYSCHYKVDTTAPVFQKDAAGNETAVIANSSMSILDEEQKTALLVSHYENGNILLVHSDTAVMAACTNLAKAKGLQDNEADLIIHLDASNPKRDMQLYAIWMQYQKNVLSVLKNLEDAGVKAYMWRPWIEFNYHQFNGTGTAGYTAFTRVFQQTVQNAIDAGLTGFLVTYSPGCWGTTIQRNPGNAYVDVYAATMYSAVDQLGHLESNQYSNYSWYVKTGKPIGFAEFGVRDGNEAPIQARGSWYSMLQDMTTYWPNACWFNIWSTQHSLPNDDGGSNGNDDGSIFVNSPYMLDLSEIYDYQNGQFAAPGIAQVFTDTDTYQGLEQRVYTAADLKALGLDLSDLCAVRLNTGYSITFYSGSDCTGESWGYAASATSIAPDVAAKFKSCEVKASENVALEKTEIYASVNDADAWKANDGAASVWTADVYDPANLAQPGTAWLYIDLDSYYTVSRYSLKNAGYAGLQTMYNTRDFQLQYSPDGETWITVDTVTGNTANQVDRNITPVTARYFRLLITGPNSCTIAEEKGVVTVAELDLLGVPAAAPLTEDEPATPPADPVVDEDTGDEQTPSDSTEPDDDDDDGGYKKIVTIITVGWPWWAWTLLIAGIVIAAGLTLFFILRHRRKKKQAAAVPPAE